MMVWLEEAQGILGFVVLAIGAMSSLVYWVNRRVRSVAIDATEGDQVSRAETQKRLSDLEADVNGLRQDVSDLGGRMAGLERNLETVARTQDVTNLSNTVAEMRGYVQSQMHTMSGQVDTLYKAALRASQEEKKQ